MTDLFTPYIAASDTSKARAVSEETSGVGEERRKLILQLLAAAPHGLTWKELSALTELHHGQVSGLLSVLHGAGNIIQLRATRDKCHPYIHPRFTDHYTERELVREPVKSRKTVELEFLRYLQEAVEDYLTDPTDDTLEMLSKAAAVVRSWQK